MQLGIRHYILKSCDEAKILPVLEQARAELWERRSKAQKTTEMEHAVQRMAPMAREKALRDLLLGRESMNRLPTVAESLCGADRRLLLLLLHNKDGIDHLEQYAIANMTADLLPEGGLLGDTSVSQDVCLLVDAALYDQLTPAVEWLCAEFGRFRSGARTVTCRRAALPPACSTPPRAIRSATPTPSPSGSRWMDATMRSPPERRWRWYKRIRNLKRREQWQT